MIHDRAFAWAMRYSERRPPDFTVGDKQLERWFVIPRNKLFNIYMHRFNSSDEDRALHDHPWCSLGWVLGHDGYNDVEAHRVRWRHAGSWTWRWPTTAHRVVLSGTRPVYTLFFTGPVVRQWGFLCPQGWRNWKEFVSIVPGGNKTGRGCEP